MVCEDSQRFARYLVPSVLVVCADVARRAVCCPRSGAAGSAPDAGDGRGSLFVPGGFLGVVAPVHDRVSVNLYGFYYGEVDAPVAQVDVPIRTTRFLTITPSYLYYEVPPSGLDTASQRPAGFTDTFEENQFRIDATVKFSVRAFEISSRSMFVRTVPSDRRHQPLSPANRDRASPRGAMATSGNRSRPMKPSTSAAMAGGTGIA